MMAAAGPDTYQRTLRVLLADPDVDAVIVVCTPTHAAPIDGVAQALAAVVADGPEKPMVANLVGHEGIPPVLQGERAVPCFPFPETAAQALARAAWYGEWRRRPPGEVPVLDGIDIRPPRRVVAEFLENHPEGGWLDPAVAGDVLRAYGIPVVPVVRVTSADEAAVVAGAVGGPVALKAADVLHKTDVGGVALNVAPAAAAAAYDEMAARLTAADAGPMAAAYVQAMAQAGIETIAGLVRDPGFGPLVMFGLGGVAAELIGDRTLRVAPLTDGDVGEMVRSLRSSPLLFGYRGSSPADVPALEDILLRLSVLGQQLPEVAELDLNPVIAGPDGARVVDWRMRIAPAPGPAVQDLRRLR
jgi:acyl-CoA synthetase (NDP forming)